MKKLLSAILLLSLFSAGLAPKRMKGASRLAQKRSAPDKGRVATKKKHTASPQRMQRARRAFIASVDLKPMARHLLENPSPAAFAGVDGYARRHSTTDAGAMARLVLGYAHILDHDYTKALDPLKRARTKAGELDDYVTYFLGVAYNGSGDANNAIATLNDFGATYPDSLLGRDAGLVYADALVAQQRFEEAVRVLETRRNPPRSDIELALGRAYLRTGDNGKAAAALRRIYFAMPLSAEADDAEKLLSSIPDVPVASFAERKARADLLLRAGRTRDAVAEYRNLLGDAPPQERPPIQLALGIALHRSGNDTLAKDTLENLAGLAAELDPQRIYELAEISRSDDERFLSLLAQLRTTAPTSPWLQEALLSAASKYLLARDYDRAIDFYRELQERFPEGKYGAYAHWKTAWLSLRQGRREEARQSFEKQIAQYPGSPQVPAAVYWRARLAEEDGDSTRAQAWYRKVVELFPNYYYADLARARLKGPVAQTDPPEEPLLQRITAAQPGVSYTAAAPQDDLRVAKANLLRNAAMYELAAKELQRAAADDGKTWAPAELARLYQDAGQYHRALETLKRTVPVYYSLEFSALPRFYWEGLFPRPYWSDLKRYSARNKLDPFLVASLVRQESEFNPGAVSRANALGLMQLLPGTGRSTARELRVRRFSTSQLLMPDVNLQLGTTFFRHMLEHYNGRTEYALAAYNAGTDRVDSWLQDGKFRDPEEFVESIPFTETREYVQAIMRNTSVYRRLYTNP